MRKPEVYVILEEVIENNRSFYDVDVQVLDESAPNRKTRFNQLSKARESIEFQVKEEFDILTVQELLKPKEVKQEGKKNYKRDVFLPKYIIHEIDFKQFKEELDDYLKNVKKWSTPYTISVEEGEDTSGRGEIYFFVDVDELSEEEMEALEKEYNDNIAFIDFLEVFLKDMFEVEYVEYEFNWLADELIVKTPFGEVL